MGFFSRTAQAVKAGLSAAAHTFSDNNSASSSVTSSATSGYDAINPKGRRKSVSSQIQPEDTVLNANKRRRLIAQSMDLQRNVGLAAWAIRQHLNYVTLFDLYISTPDETLTSDLQTLFERDSRMENCDVGGRHSWNRMRRLAEVRKTLDGDVGIMRLRSGYLQGIEAHCIVNPDRIYSGSTWEQGVLLGPGKRAKAYNVREVSQGKRTDRMVSADNMFLLGCFEGRFDQVRGISSFTAGMNEYRDLYETLDYASAKVKVEQLFALAILRDKETVGAAPTVGRRVDGVDDSDSDESTDAQGDVTRTPQVACGDGPALLDMDPGEKPEFLQATNPSSSTQDFLRLSIHLALLSLDIPMNFFDPKYVNYSGGRTAWNQYERSCISKREDQLALHDWYTRWRLARYLYPKEVGGTGEIILPRSIDGSDIRCEWVPRGVPWWKPSEELQAELQAIGGAIDTPQMVTRRHGNGDWYRNVDEIAKAQKYAESRGVQLKFGGSPSPFTIVTGEDQQA